MTVLTAGGFSGKLVFSKDKYEVIDISGPVISSETYSQFQEFIRTMFVEIARINKNKVKIDVD